MRPSDRFLNLFNQLDRHLRELTGIEDRHQSSFVGVLQVAAKRDATIKRHERGIRGYVDLRNAIVHDSRYGQEPIAEPHPEAVDVFERYVENITKPRRLDSVGSRVEATFSPTDRLTDFLHYLRANDFSQAVVWSEDGGTHLLSAEGIARWLALHVEIGIVEIDKVELAAPLAEEPEGTFRVLARNRALADAQELFEGEASTPGRLSAILVTHSGRSDEKPIRIITPWDLLELS